MRHQQRKLIFMACKLEVAASDMKMMVSMGEVPISYTVP